MEEEFHFPCPHSPLAAKQLFCLLPQAAGNGVPASTGKAQKSLSVSGGGWLKKQEKTANAGSSLWLWVQRLVQFGEWEIFKRTSYRKLQEKNETTHVQG